MDVIFSHNKLEGVYRCRDVIEGDDERQRTAKLFTDDDDGKRLSIRGNDPGDFNAYGGHGIHFEPGKRYRVVIEELPEEENLHDPS